jgi:succinate dehydrogenase / fumarate reductase iron-sulfur subunit
MAAIATDQGQPNLLPVSDAGPGGAGPGKTINLTLHVWRQRNRADIGRFLTYEARDINTDMSFLEMLDVINEGLIGRGEEPIAFDHDCREGICGQCGVVINGAAHGPRRATTTCQLVRDLMVDRGALDRIIAAGGFISVRTGNAVDGNALPIAKETAELAMDAAACIGCGACVAACPNASAMLFVAAKASHLNLLPQGQPERNQRVVAMVEAQDAEGLGTCSNHAECEAACPKAIPIEFISRLYRDYIKSSFFGRVLPRPPQTRPRRP